MTDTASTDEAPVPEPDPNAVKLFINGKEVVARKGDLIIKAAQDAGVYIPRFCYHERMNPVGMCRMCLCEVDSGRGPAITPTCMVTVAPDMKVDTESETTKRIQEGVLELLLANHPLDCPVCDKGGECPLQDNAMSHGPGESRFVEEKRHYEKPIAISDLVFLDRERCILCDRCTRFADEVAGDKLIHFTSRGNNTQVLTFPDEPFASYFSGNTVQICPVGALTAKPYRFKARPWDLSQTESTCTSCSVGCRVVVQSSQDKVLRLQGVDSDPVNWGWLCDRGRFNFESLSSEARLESPAVRQGDQLVSTSWSAALAKAAEIIKDTVASDGAQGIGIIGGARGTNEDAFVWSQLAAAIGTPNIYAQLMDGLSADLFDLPQATIDETCSAPTIILLSPDLKDELPVLFLRVRDAVEKKRSKVIEFSPTETGMTRYAWKSVQFRTGEQAAAVATTLADPEIAAQLAKGQVVVIAGKANIAEHHRFQQDAVANVFAAAPGTKVLPALRRGNVNGALRLGFRPAEGGMYTTAMLEAAANGKLGCLVLLGADPLSDFPDTNLVRRALAGVRNLIAVDTFVNSSGQHASVLLPAAAFAEKSGTTTNLEGRVSTLTAKVNPVGTARPDWMIAVELADRLGHDLGFGSVTDVTNAIAAKVPAFAGITAAALAGAPDGILVDRPGTGSLPAAGEGAKAPNGYAHRLVTSRKLYDNAVSTQASHSLAALPPGASVHVHPLDLDRLGAKSGIQLRVSSPRGALVLTSVADEGVPRGSVWVPFNQPDINIGELIDASADVCDVVLESISSASEVSA